jgi:AraC-like DNA-binding protein
MWHFCDSNDLVPSRHIYLFMQHAARAAGTEVFGLRAGEANAFESLGAFGKAVSRSLTTRHALDTFCRLVPWFTSGSGFWLSESGEDLWLCRRPVETFDAGRRQMEQYVLMQMIKVVRLGAGPRWLPARIDLQSDPWPALVETKALAGTEIRYRRAATAIAIPRAVLARELRPRPGDAGASGKKPPDHLVSTAPARDFAGSIRQLAGTLLREGCPRIETVAEIAGLSVRSLQRRLRAEGHSYSELVEQARYLAAREMLRDGGIGITEVALDVGYSDAANFNRAFRRWTGVTPRQFRRQQLHA